MISKNNLIKKLIGMSIFQTAIILFYVSLGVKEGATVPIYKAEHDPHGHAVSHDANDTEVDAGVVHSPQALEQGHSSIRQSPASRTYADCNCGWGGYSRIGFGANSKNFSGIWNC